MTARPGPDGLAARSDRSFEAPVIVRDGRVGLATDRLFKVDGDRRLTLDLDALAAALAERLAGRGLRVIAGELVLLEASRVPALTQAISAVPTQAEVQAIQAKVNELVSRLVQADHLQE